MSNISLLEFATAFITLSTVFAIIFGGFSRAKSMMNDAVECEAKERKERFGDLDHRVRNTHQRVDAIERLRINDVERIVRLETSMESFKEGQARIEHNLEVARKDAATDRAEIIDSLRELRNVTPK